MATLHSFIVPVSDDDTEDAGDDDLRDNECGDCVTIVITNPPISITIIPMS